VVSQDAATPEAGGPAGLRVDARTTEESFIVSFWSAVFSALGRISLFAILRSLLPCMRSSQRRFLVVEVWVLGHLGLAVLATILASRFPGSLIVTLLMWYGGFRVFEIVVYQINVLLFDEYRARRRGQAYFLRSYRRMVVLLLHNYAEVVLWFATALLNLQGWLWLELEDASLGTAFRSALLGMVTYSHDRVGVLERGATVFLTLQSVVGAFMTLITFARFLALVPAASSSDPYERAQ
jgi:hypothetical protein